MSDIAAALVADQKMQRSRREVATREAIEDAMRGGHHCRQADQSSGAGLADVEGSGLHLADRAPRDSIWIEAIACFVSTDPRPGVGGMRAPPVPHCPASRLLAA